MFPKLEEGWSAHRTPRNSTRISARISGREVRAALYAYPLYDIELVYEGLSSDDALGAIKANSLQKLMGFFLQMQGQFGQFLWASNDPLDRPVTGQLIGVGNGTFSTFTFQRSIDDFFEPVGRVETSGLNVYVGGALQSPGSYTVNTNIWPNTVTLASTPAVGVRVTADFAFYYVARFAEDKHEYENFMYRLWQLDSCKLQTLKPA